MSVAGEYHTVCLCVSGQIISLACNDRSLALSSSEDALSETR